MIRPMMRIEFAPGSQIADACASAVAFSKLLNADLIFKFNDKELRVTEHSTPESLESSYWQRRKEAA